MRNLSCQDIIDMLSTLPEKQRKIGFEPNGINILLPDGDTMMRITVCEFYNDFRTIEAEVIEQEQIDAPKKLDAPTS